MRDYGTVAPQFWTGKTGRALQALGPEAVMVAMYLMTNRHANMIGLYYLPKVYIAHETGLPFEGASKGLQWAIEAGFCSYDEASEYVFVHAMARFQVAESLDPKDKRCKGIQKELEKAPKGPLRMDFMRVYRTAFHLCDTSPSEAPSKPLLSQEQEQEQEQEKHESSNEDSSAPPDGAAPPRKADPIPYQAIIDAYNGTLTDLAKVRELTGKRRTLIRSAWQASPRRRSVAFFAAYFAECQDDPFLNGTGPYRNGHENWRPSFDYLLRADVITRTFERAMDRMDREEREVAA